MSRYNTILDIVEKGLKPEKGVLESAIDSIKDIPDNEYVQDFLRLIEENPKTSVGIGTGVGTLGGLMLGSDDEDYADDEILFEILRNVQNRGR